jgi:CubicO group peptidase (beta-lactamase class C family)
MMRSKGLPIFALALLLAATVAVRADNVDDFVKSEIEKQHIAGVSIAVIKDGKIVKAEGYGFANIELNVPAKPETVYKIGSVSKQFIASGIMLLIDEGRISLEDKISKFLEGAPETWKDITVRHLLTHTSGIVREAPGFDPMKVQNEADVIKTAYPLPLRFQPGEKWEYCNVGYFTLAEIIRKVSGKPWPDYLKEHLFGALEMNATRTTTMTDLVPNRANGYLWKSGNQQNAEIYFALRPSGAFLSTVLDLAKWDAALHTDKILKQSAREQMWTPVKLNNGTTHPYGFGWELSTRAGHRVVSHGGSLPGFRSALYRFVNDKLTVVVLTNSDNANPGAIAIGIADQYIPGLIPQRIAVKVNPKIFEAYAGQYQPNPSLVVTVTPQGDKLMMQQGSSEKQELVPESESSFFMPSNREVTYTFVKDEKGQVTHLVVQREGQEVGRAKKIK